MSGFTRIPNEIIDEHLPNLSCGELRVFLFIARQTVGWNKETDAMSLKQLVAGIGDANKGTGLTKKSVLSALKGLVEKKLIEHERQENDRLGHVASRYSLASNLYQACSKKDTTLGVESTTRVGVESTPSPCSTNDPTQKTVEQKTLPKEKDDVVARAQEAIGLDEFDKVIRYLYVGMTEEAMEMVSSGIVEYPNQKHLHQARRYKSKKGGHFHSITSMQRALDYVDWLGREENPPWKTNGATTANGRSHLKVVDEKREGELRSMNSQLRKMQESGRVVGVPKFADVGGPSAAAQ